MLSSQKVISAILRLPCVDHADFTVVYMNKMLKGYGIATHENINDIKCTVKCVEHYKCRSYNFDVNKGSCHLNSKAFGDNDTELTDSPGWYYKSTDYDNTLLGPTCEELRPCPPDILCRDTCTSPFYECVTCDENHTGLHCDKLIDRDECANKPCKNGTCIDKIASYQCKCNAGYIGKDCETEMDECQSLPCFNGGTCNDLIGKFNCSCITGYNGTHCENEINECKSSPCQNGAACRNLIGQFVCNCLPGYNGVFCENDIDECTGVICQNGGTCNNQIAKFTCSCIPGYSATYCETDINECQGVVCQNGATCQNLINHFNCDCIPGYLGTYCETDINECQGVVCQNGATCKNLINRFKCDCIPGYAGTHCATDIDECQSTPCKNNGTCINKVNSYQCNCHNGALGKNCETVVGKSCKEIQEKYPSYVSGKYVINATRIGEEYTIVYCDMTTDGGGWTQALYVKSNTDDFNVFKSKPVGKISTLTGFTPSGNYGMKTSALADLRKITGFQQLRFRCQTSSHGDRLINIKTQMNPSGAAVLEYFCSKTEAHPASCGSYQAYVDDNSILSAGCSKWRHGKWVALNINEKLFNHPMWIDSQNHWNVLLVENRYECDDPEQVGVIHDGDIWEVYVR